MKLPVPGADGKMSVEKAIGLRRTARAFSPRSLDRAQLSQVLWAAQGVTDPGGFKRAAPSAGALYPMDLFVAVGHDAVSGTAPGVYHYDGPGHSLSLILQGDHRDELARAALSQFWLAKAPVSLVITAEYRRVTGKYGARGERYAMIEAGHIAQNIFIQAVAAGLAAGIVGAFNDAEVRRILQVDAAMEPLLIMPVGYGTHK